jgi:hypothetical protein
MRELGVWEKCKYTGISDDPRDAFRDLAHDLRFAEDFFTGTAAVLSRAAEREASGKSAKCKF